MVKHITPDGRLHYYTTILCTYNLYTPECGEFSHVPLLADGGHVSGPEEDEDGRERGEVEGRERDSLASVQQ